MNIEEEIRILLVKEKLTLTELARLASALSDKKFTLGSLSQKFRKKTLRFEEAELLLRALNYSLKIIKNP